MSKSTKRPAFFKVFLEQLSSEMMEIPGDFYSKNLKNKKWKVVYLTGPSGNTWKMDVIERPDYEGLYLGGAGWKTFLKDHSIITGHFLVFKFDDGELFNFKYVKKMGGMLLVQHIEEAPLPDQSFDLHLKVKIYDPTCCEKRSAFAAKPFQSCTTDLIKVREEEQVEAVYVQPLSTRHPNHHLPEICWQTGGEPSSVAAANCPFFIGRIKHRKYYSIDEEFKREYLSNYSNSTVVILSFGDKEWSVTTEMERKGRRLNIFKGWKKFSQDNHLSIGDRLRFEMVGDFQFDVYKI